MDVLSLNLQLQWFNMLVYLLITAVVIMDCNTHCSIYCSCRAETLYLQNRNFSANEKKANLKTFYWTISQTKSPRDCFVCGTSLKMKAGWRYEVLQTVWGTHGVKRFSRQVFLILIISQIFVKPTDRHKGWPIVLIYEKNLNDEIWRYKVLTQQQCVKCATVNWCYKLFHAINYFWCSGVTTDGLLEVCLVLFAIHDKYL